MKGSPVESVSSSPMKMLYQNQVSPMMTETAGRVDFRFDVASVSSAKKQEMDKTSRFGTFRRRKSGLTMDNGSKNLDSKNKPIKETAINDNDHAPKHEVLSNMRHPLSGDFSLESGQNSPAVGKNSIRKLKDSSSEKQPIQRERDKNESELNNPCRSNAVHQSHKHDPPTRIEPSSALMEPWSGKVRIDLRQGQDAVLPSKQASGPLGPFKKSPMDSRPHNESVPGDTSKYRKGTTNENVINKEAEKRSLPLDASLWNKNVSSAAALKEAEGILKEAEELSTHADLIKSSGFSSESNYEYFKASLKFLHGASLLEVCDAEPSKQMETSPMQMYGAAAQLASE
ncbi:cysteine-tryptophan domain-containing zinc finger protein 3-like isoform X2 [Salvia splendens]|uniref:cysteine-tryptophan domain-containing zinc finger protein 3-like isoform X2 n=1 Tax=Salvia splendens TaxID=180675 RepID=UPI001C270ABB|nr:cysteine-tryptophan domain-containing zinc finger protein 3-like isoform X2 [Salvia splendens]